jgi:hypothetical protein
MVTGLEEMVNDAHCGQSRRDGDAVLGVFEGGESLLEGGSGGIIEAAIDEFLRGWSKNF